MPSSNAGAQGKPEYAEVVDREDAELGAAMRAASKQTSVVDLNSQRLLGGSGFGLKGLSIAEPDFASNLTNPTDTAQHSVASSPNDFAEESSYWSKLAAGPGPLPPMRIPGRPVGNNPFEPLPGYSTTNPVRSDQEQILIDDATRIRAIPPSPQQIIDGLFSIPGKLGELINDINLIFKKPSEILADNIEKETGIKRPDGAAAHHIAAHGHTNDANKDSLRILDRFGINVNSASNGVYLPDRVDSQVPGAYHRSLHNDKYFQEVNRRLRDAETIGSREAIEETLRSIGKSLTKIDFPGAKPVPRDPTR